MKHGWVIAAVLSCACQYLPWGIPPAAPPDPPAAGPAAAAAPAAEDTPAPQEDDLPGRPWTQETAPADSDPTQAGSVPAVLTDDNAPRIGTDPTQAVRSNRPRIASFHEILRIVEAWAAENTADPQTALRMAVLHVLEANYPAARAQLDLVPEESRDTLYRLVDAVVHNSLGSLETAETRLREVSTEWSRANGVSIPLAILCERVDGFREYEMAADNHFLSGDEVLIYCEVDDFFLQETAGRHNLALRYTWQFFDRYGQEILIPPWQNVAEDVRTVRRAYRGPVTDYHQWFRFRLPRNLSLGRYSIRITVEDLNAGLASEPTDVEINVLPQ